MKPSNKTQLIEAVIHSWNHVISTDELERLVSSMKDRCKAVIEVKDIRPSIDNAACARHNLVTSINV